MIARRSRASEKESYLSAPSVSSNQHCRKRAASKASTVDSAPSISKSWSSDQQIQKDNKQSPKQSPDVPLVSKQPTKEPVCREKSICRAPQAEKSNNRCCDPEGECRFRRPHCNKCNTKGCLRNIRAICYCEGCIGSKRARCGSPRMAKFRAIHGISDAQWDEYMFSSTKVRIKLIFWKSGRSGVV